MLEGAGFLGWLAAALLFAAAAAWLKMWRDGLLRRVNGTVEVGSDQAENASRLLALAAGLSAVAAVLAILGVMFA